MTKVSALGAESSPSTDDLLMLVDMAGPTSKKVTLAALITLFFTTSSIPSDYRQGWSSAGETWSYSSWDSTNKTGILTVPTDATTKYSKGMRLRFVQSTGGTKYGIITDMTSTTLKVYFGTDYTLNNEAITSPFYSTHKAPYAFPLDPSKWTVTTTSTNTSVANPGAVDTFINQPAINISVPIGVWELSLKGSMAQNNSSSGLFAPYGGLSTSASSASDQEMIVDHLPRMSGTSTAHFGIYVRKTIAVTSATTYYPVIAAEAGGGTITIGFLGGTRDGTIVIKAICAYL